MKITDKKLLDWHPSALSGGDGDVRAHTVCVLTTRVPHQCLANQYDKIHTIAAGSRVVREMAVVDERWYVWYMCESCIVAWAKECDEL